MSSLFEMGGLDTWRQASSSAEYRRLGAEACLRGQGALLNPITNQLSHLQFYGIITLYEHDLNNCGQQQGAEERNESS